MSFIDYLPYIICLTICLAFVLYLYVLMRYGFWANQPVFHDYDIKYKLYPPGIINTSLPKKNKYLNFSNINTLRFDQITSLQKQRVIHLIRENYKQNYKQNNKPDIFEFSPKDENILPYLLSHSKPVFVSFYYNDRNMLDIKTGNIIVDKQIVGSITTRTLSVHINIRKNIQTMDVYFMDFLCKEKLHRNNDICDQLIQTHYYNQLLSNDKIYVSIFKREGKSNMITGVVPFCRYITYGFSANTWTKPPEFAANYSILEINAHNFRHLYDFMKQTSGRFDIIIQNDLSNMMELIKTKNIFIYAVLTDQTILCCYFFRKSSVFGENGIESVTCFASICNCDEHIFIHGYKISFWKIASDNLFGYSMIDNISHNNTLIYNIIQKTVPSNRTENAYYFYNFAYTSFKAEKCLIIH
jgi:hypothetical protein